MKICGQEFGEETIIRIREIIGEGLSRTRLSQEVCRLLDWKNRAGRLKEMSCRLALKVLHEKGEIVLPEARVISIGKKGSTQASAVGPVSELSVISGPLSDLGKIGLVRVNSADKALSRLWFDLMVRYHYLGSGTLCGAQVRYLIRSGTKGVVGAASFSSAAWKVAVRDAWIGWSPERRGECLPRPPSKSGQGAEGRILKKPIAFESEEYSCLEREFFRDYRGKVRNKREKKTKNACVP